MEIPLLPRKRLKEILERGKNEQSQTQYFFLLYKHVHDLVNWISNLDPSSAVLKKHSTKKYAVLLGLLMRISKLMSAVECLSEEGGHGANTAILDRCTVESSIIIQWLCAKKLMRDFERYIVGGLKSDLKLEKYIKNNIKEKALPIEQRMLKSISGDIKKSGFSRRKIEITKVLPNLEQLIKDINLNDLIYIVSIKIGSHSVHGTWTHLLHQHINFDENKLSPIKFDTDTHLNSYCYVSLFVLEACYAYIKFSIKDIELLKIIQRYLLEAQHFIREPFSSLEP